MVEKWSVRSCYSLFFMEWRMNIDSYSVIGNDLNL